MRLPFRADTLTSSFGWRHHPITGRRSFHTGIDLAPHAGAAITPIAAGTVLAARWDAERGNVIEIDHGAGIVSKYWHMRDPTPLCIGDDVTEDTELGQVGRTGTAAAGDHLHLEIWVAGVLADPLDIIRTNQEKETP
jgi:murein DD-endopeptidase MepM/ murein hydrolase activator NlpD